MQATQQQRKCRGLELAQEQALREKPQKPRENLDQSGPKRQHDLNSPSGFSLLFVHGPSIPTADSRRLGNGAHVGGMPSRQDSGPGDRTEGSGPPFPNWGPYAFKNKQPRS